MKRLLGILVFTLMAAHAYAQEVDFGAFGDAGTLLAPPAPAARGAAPAARGAALPTPPPPDRLVRLRDALVKAEAPMTKEQEAALNKLLDTEIPAMRQTLQTHGRQMLAERAPAPVPPAAAAGATPGAAPAAPVAPAAPSPQAIAQAQAAAAAAIAARGGAPGAAGAAPNPALLAAALAARGAAASPSSRVPAEVLDALEVEMRQMNDALFGKIASSSALDAKQQGVLVKMARTQVKARGGFDALRITMEDAGAPFSAEQTPKVQALFEDQKKARADVVKESQGTPDPAKLKQLGDATLAKVIGVLNPAQRTAFLAYMRAQQ